MSNDLVGMNVAASQALADSLGEWSRRANSAREQVEAGEQLSDVSTNTVLLIDQIGSDGAVMAEGIRRAASALSSFVISLPSERAIAEAVLAVKRFDGGDNDPELDRRLRVLRALVEDGVASRADAPHVMAQLLAAKESVFVGHRNVDPIKAAQGLVERLNRLEVTGAISANDPRIDQAVQQLRDALQQHSTSEEETDRLLAAFLADRDRQIWTEDLLASVLTNRPVENIHFAHINGLDYHVAEGVMKLDRVDQLTAAMSEAPPEVAAMMREARDALLTELLESDEERALQALDEMLGDGLTAFDAFLSVEAHVGNSLARDQVHAVALELDLDLAEAEVRLAEMAATTVALVERGWNVEDAAAAAQLATLGGVELDIVESVAADEGLSLVSAATRLAQADAMAMTLAEFDAYQGLMQHFDDFDAASTTDVDGIVSIEDLAFVKNNPQRFDAEAVAAASAILEAPHLRNRLDTAQGFGDVVGGDGFGADRPDDYKISLADLQAFHYKQTVNFVLQDQVDVIDVAAQGGQNQLADGALREEDFQAALDNAEELGLTTKEVDAVRLVLDADWYDKTWWQANAGSVILAGAVVVGSAVFVASGGLSAGLSALLISTAYATASGAAFGSGVTLVENAVTGDPLAEDVAHHAALGAAGGFSGAGLATVPKGLLEGGLIRAVASALGGAGEISGLVANGLADPLLDDVTELGVQRRAGQASYVAAGASFGLDMAEAGGNLVLARMVDDAASPTNYAGYGAEFAGTNTWSSQLSDPLPDRFVTEAVPAIGLPQVSVGADVADDVSAFATQRTISVLIDDLVEETAGE